MKDEIYMHRCIELARKALGNTYPNPMVGAVIVHQGQIIAEGYHQRSGQPHAEINAINKVPNPEILKEATIYVSLEPCAHFGKTPPCAQKIIDLGFKKVVIGAMDSNEKVRGKGKKMIEDAGIEVLAGVLEEQCRALNKRFFTFHEKKRPFIFLKWAESADGFIDKNFQPVAISNPLATQYVHKLRAEEHAILVGSQTALNDNPSLTTRHYAGRNPLRILIDFDLKVPANYNIFNSEAETIIFNAHKTKTQEHLRWIQIDKKNFIPHLMQQLHHLDIQSVLVEGGQKTLQSFIDANIWDEALLIRNPHLYLEKGTRAPIINGSPAQYNLIRDNELKRYTNQII